MELLDPHQIKSEKSKSEESTMKRIADLRDEESRLVQVVNLARENADKEIAELNNHITQFRNEVHTERAILQTEINRLLEQKKILLQPIYEIQQKADQLYTEAKKYKIDLENKEQILAKDREKLNEDVDFLEQNKRNLKIIESDLVREKSELLQKERQIELSANEQMVKWENIYDLLSEIEARSNELNEKEASLQTTEETLAIRAQQQDEREEKQNSRDRELKSQYKALQQAKIHLNK